MDTYYFTSLTTEDVPQVFAFFQSLKNDQAQVSFSEVEKENVLSAWVNDPANLTYLAKDSKSHKVLSVIRGKRDLSPQKQHAAFLTAATVKAARGSGIAAKLTQYALGEMKAQGVTIARIYVYSDNRPSLNAVKKLGFEKAGVVKWHHYSESLKDYVDDIIFHKVL